jgi:hypothetical protein
VLLHWGQINSSGFPQQSGRLSALLCRQLNSLVKLVFDRAIGWQAWDVEGAGAVA